MGIKIKSLKKKIIEKNETLYENLNSNLKIFVLEIYMYLQYPAV